MRGNRDPLELFVEAELGDILSLRLTSGSGNQLGDGDLKPQAYHNESDMTFGFECKRTTRSRNHLVTNDDWIKAIKQIKLQGHTPVMVTQNSVHSKMVHMDFEDFKQLLELAKEKGVTFSPKS